MRRSIPILTAAATLLAWAGAASALTVPFTEDFGSDVAGWEDNVNEPLAFQASGGADGSSYAQGTFNFDGFSSSFGGGPVIFRANASDAASGGAFTGDWIAGGVTEIAATVRHDTGEDLEYFLRVATAQNFPGAVLQNVEPTVVPSGEWTRVSWEIPPPASLCALEGIPDCQAALSSVGNFQIGTNAPSALTSIDQDFEFGIDQVSIVPEPGTASLALLGLAGLGALGRGRAARRR